MNIDNMMIFGEMIDYGLCVFMECYDFVLVYSLIDYGGCYVFGNQLQIVFWNFVCFVEILILLIDSDEEWVVECVKKFFEGFIGVYVSVQLSGSWVKFGFIMEVEVDVDFF